MELVCDRSRIGGVKILHGVLQTLSPGEQFIARTDHQTLKWLYSLQEPKDRIARRLETLSAYQFSIEYWPSNKRGNADEMSRRCSNPQECKCPLLKEEVLKCGPC